MAATWQMTTVDHTARQGPGVGRFRAEGANRQQVGTPPRAVESASAERCAAGERIIPTTCGGLLREAALQNRPPRSRRRVVSRQRRKPPPPVVDRAEDHARGKEGRPWNAVEPLDVIASPFGGLRQGAKPPYAGYETAHSWRRAVSRQRRKPPPPEIGRAS